MIEIKKKYFYFWIRLEKLEFNNYYIAFNDVVKGLSIFFMKIFLHVYIRIGKRRKQNGCIYDIKGQYK